MKIIRLLITTILVICCVSFVSCQNSSKTSNNGITPEKQEIELIKQDCYLVTLQDNVSYFYNDNIRLIEENCLYITKNSTISVLYTGISDNLSNNCTFYIDNFEGFIINNELYPTENNSLEIIVNDNLTISAKINYGKFIGVTAYQNIDELFYWTEIKNNNFNLSNYISINEESVTTLDNFLVYGILNNNNSDIISNTNSTYLKSENNITIGLELFLETTEVCISLIYEDSYNNYHIVHHSILPIDFSIENQIIISDIFIKSSNTNFTLSIEFSNNYGSTKK